MAHYRSIDEVLLPTSWVTIGIFDGIHRGHQEIIRLLTEGAHAQGLPAVALTFHPHPASVLGQKSGIKLLTLPDEKALFLTSLGVDEIITHPFNRDFADLSPLDFLTYFLQHVQIQRLCIGYDFALGKDREGNANHLKRLGMKFGFDVQRIEPVQSGDQIISSQMIRRHLSEGNISEVTHLLGRHYSLRGRVIHGDGRGRKINIPTANIGVQEEKLLPANGVYACWVWIDNHRFSAVTNIGIRPTFSESADIPSVEAHILDYSDELYDREINLEFKARLRSEKRFSDVADLVAQIHQDITHTREVLK